MDSTTIKQEVEDEIIREMDIYINSDLNECLSLFQFPTMNEESGQSLFPIETKIKPNSGLVELELKIDTNLSTYNFARGRELGVGLDEKSAETDDMMHHITKPEGQLYDRHSLSGKLTPINARSLVGAIKDNSLHLTLIDKSASFSPNFKALDNMKQKLKEVHNEKVNDGKGTGVAKAVQLQLINQNNLGEERKRSVIDQFRERNEESWKRILYFNKDSEESDKLFQRLFNQSENVIEFNSNKMDYLNAISAMKVDNSIPDNKQSDADIE
ncbi:hypothetical protein K502DRAFT_339909 [Neoconidiobolus thromboides FSU 785]|nr:hypothetical protein K502DRAFT_339909 [Neoconidiobolus thromboides FSU 785]